MLVRSLKTSLFAFLERWSMVQPPQVLQTPPPSPRKVTTAAPHTSKMASAEIAELAGIPQSVTSRILSTNARYGALVLFRYVDGDWEPDSVVDVSEALLPEWFAARCAAQLLDEPDTEFISFREKVERLNVKARRLEPMCGPYFMVTGPDPTWEMVNIIWAYMTDEQKIKLLKGEA